MFSTIQIGLDIGTSISVIIAIITYRVTKNEERKKGIEKVRLDILKKTSQRLYEIINECREFEVEGTLYYELSKYDLYKFFYSQKDELKYSLLAIHGFYEKQKTLVQYIIDDTIKMMEHLNIDFSEVVKSSEALEIAYKKANIELNKKDLNAWKDAFKEVIEKMLNVYLTINREQYDALRSL